MRNRDYEMCEAAGEKPLRDGGPLDLPRDGSPTLRCPYCGRKLIVLADLREGKPVPTTGSSDSELLKEIDRLIAGGNKIAAIQQYRDATGSTLREAKESVERQEAGEEAGRSGLRTERPPYKREYFTDESSSTQVIVFKINP